MYLLLSSLCLIVTINWPAVLFTTTTRSSLSWNDFILYTQLHRLMIIVAWRRLLCKSLVSLLSIGMECVECGRVTHCNGTHGMRARWLIVMACLVCVECGRAWLTAMARVVCGRADSSEWHPRNFENAWINAIFLTILENAVHNYSPPTTSS